jgi:hypothetical protein
MLNDQTLIKDVLDDLVEDLQGSRPIDTISPLHVGMIVTTSRDRLIAQVLRNSPNIPPSGKRMLGVNHLVFQKALETDLQTEEGLVQRFGGDPGVRRTSVITLCTDG